MKDRLALGVIEEAERTGKLKPGQTVVEATSGSSAATRNGGAQREIDRIAAQPSALAATATLLALRGFVVCARVQYQSFRRAQLFA